MLRTIACLSVFLATIMVSAQGVNYSPAFFGPNANPVPDFNNARIPSETTLRMSGDYHFGYGDITGNLTVDIEVPLLPERVSLRVWTTTLEGWKVAPEVYALRNMEGGKFSGMSNGDIYVQTRIRLLKEGRIAPSIVLNSTLKTASGTNFSSRRYFDTPGYYFDVEFGKSFLLHNDVLSEVRGAVDLGFLCWETSGSRQNDAPMYGAHVLLSNKWVDWEHSISGYCGWMRNGDAPLVYGTEVTFKLPKASLFAEYQYGIIDFPYHHISFGVAVSFACLTPRFR